MKWIVVTQPYEVSREAQLIERLLDMGVDYLHLRRPQMGVEGYESLLQSIPSSLHPRLTLHDHFELSERYEVGGLHLNSRQDSIPDTFCGRVSRSCHLLQEVEEWKSHVDYLFLSPIFDSISKSDYRAAFTHEELSVASACGLIDDKVVALGGVKLDNIPYLRQLGFGGVALLGDVWQRIDNVEYLKKIKDAVR